eukprot:CAMPEP_0115829638 /NCGR_PEP_ID=MMETSP0287-20121206/1203_1 /TAXON_ID=412157 /ORGANISM="Chrysochromulina rotalis, Strain UIO044" /LENGTH=108 /DNA_ID=CAMNT_0003282913 /DNA_START=193 /DNA_END=519 /DNA_ORIENTATION=+
MCLPRSVAPIKAHQVSSRLCAILTAGAPKEFSGLSADATLNCALVAVQLFARRSVVQLPRCGRLPDAVEDSQKRLGFVCVTIFRVALREARCQRLSRLEPLLPLSVAV